MTDNPPQEGSAHVRWAAVRFGSRRGDVSVTWHAPPAAVPASSHDGTLAFVAFAQREDVIGAATHLGRLIDEGVRVDISRTDEHDLTFALCEGTMEWRVETENLLATDKRSLERHGAAWWALFIALAAFAQTLYRRGQRDAARELLENYQTRYGHSHILTDVNLAQNRLQEQGEEASVLVRNTAIGGLDYLDYFKGKHCRVPFDGMEIRSDGEVFTCCPSHLVYSYGNIFKAQSAEELTSSVWLEKIRDSVLSQDYRYCRWMHCPVFNGGGPPAMRPHPKTEYKPVEFRLSYDPTCNLWCPSCRTEKIVAKGSQLDRISRLTDNIVLPMLRSGRSVTMNGYGDVFGSRSCRRILERANPTEYPDLKFDFITNGVLFTRKEWSKFPNVHTMVRMVRVSIDAAEKETYDKVRLGGDWNILMENLSFISELRRDGIIERFYLSMVIQDSNYRQMADFAMLAQRLGCDGAIFEPIMNWNSFPLEVFQTKAVHYSTHPEHGEFLKELQRLREALPAPLATDREDARGGRPSTAVHINL